MDDELTFIPTRAARLKKKSEESFQSVVFESYKRKPKKQVTDNNDPVVPDRKELDMKRVRFEVFKFGMSAFNPDVRGQLEANIAIKLGAKPEKKKYTNYKELMKERKEEVRKKKKEKELIAIGKVKGLSTDTGKKFLYGSRQKKKDKGGILESYGKPGDASFKKRKKFKR